MEIKKAGIIGLGLIGGSLAKVLKNRCHISHITAFNRRQEPLIEAMAEGVIDAYTKDIDRHFAECDIIFICTPVDKIKDYVSLLAPIIKKGCILTDAGSTKKSIMAEVGGFKGLSFIGGHPMAGSEKSGYRASKEYLFENAYYILTPGAYAEKNQIDAMEDLILKMGAIPVIVKATAHDHAVAAISHVPHVIASALVNMVDHLDRDDEKKLMHHLAAGGFKDITRIASASPEMWHSISFENKEEIVAVLSAFENEVGRYKEKLKAMDDEAVLDFFTSAKTYRDSFAHFSAGAFMQSYEMQIDVEDKPGSVAAVVTLLSANNINIKNIGIKNNREYENGVMEIIFSQEEDLNRSISLLENMNFNIHVKK